MAIFRFRVTFEDYDDVYRDIEIRSSQTFKDFHEAILNAINFDHKHAASFFVSDAFWRKGTEITLLPEDLEEGVKLMEKTKIASCVEDPHQHFVYLYDKNVNWSFNIQLIKIVKDEIQGTYPSCVKVNGTAPKQYKPVATPKDENLTAAAGLAGLMQEISDDEAYRAANEKPEEIIDEEEAKSVVGGDETEESDEQGSDEEEENFDEEESSGGFDEEEEH